MLVLELQLLHEIGRVSVPAQEVITGLVGRIGLRISEAPFGRVVAIAQSLSWTRDPFDRLIVAQAMAENAPLLTKDRLIRQRYKKALWA
jgi:PIN domain nuclease of toxin-antitoxin system